MQTKKQLFLLCLLYFTPWSLLADNQFLVRPDQEHVALNVARIKQEEKHIAVKRAIFLTSLVAGGSFLAYKFFWTSSTPAVAAPVATQITPEAFQRVATKVDGIESRVNTIGQDVTAIKDTIQIKNTDEKKDALDGAKFVSTQTLTQQTTSTPTSAPSENILYSSYKWLKTQTGSILHLTAATALFYAIQSGLGPVGKYFTRFDGFVDKWLSYIFHEDTLVWFLETHTKHESTLQELESYAHDKSAFTDTWALFTQQVESIVAYMYIQAEALEHKNTITAQRAEIIAQTLLEDTTQAALDFEHALESDSIETVAEKVQNYMQKFNKSLDHFKFVELFRNM